MDHFTNMNYVLTKIAGPIPEFLIPYVGKPDTRVRGYPFVNSALYPVLFLGVYGWLVFYGPGMMRTRYPMKLRGSMFFFNMAQIILAAFVCSEVFLTSYFLEFSYIGQGISNSRGYLSMRMVAAFWWFHILKILCLMDTMFIVLRKSTQQFKWLHCYHHASMYLISYLLTLYLPGGQAFFSVYLMSFVQIIMNAYYLMTIAGYRTKRFRWIRKHFRRIQVLQVVLITVHFLIGFINDNGPPKILFPVALAYDISLIIVFAVDRYNAQMKMKPLKDVNVTKSSYHEPGTGCMYYLSDPIVREMNPTDIKEN